MSNRLVVGDASWADMIPKWLLDKVAEERMFLGLASLLKPDIEQVGDAEVVAYLMPATMRAPMYHEYANIYLYLSGKLVLERGMDLPDELREHVDRGLSSDEERELKDLRRMIYRARGGEINHPLLDALRDFKKNVSRKALVAERHEAKKKEREEKTGQFRLFAQ
jgi:hypothetical protein